MSTHTLLNLIGYFLLTIVLLINYTSDRTNEKWFHRKLIMAGMAMGVFVSAILVGVMEYLQK
jgi:ABC-type Fe3+-siderophore transport system permease subunit